MPEKRPDETYGRPHKKPAANDTMATGFPGQIGLLAQQMNRGFGGGILAQRNYLNSFYSPMQAPQTPTYGVDEKAVADKTKTTGGTGDAFELDPRMAYWQRLLYADPNMQAKLQALQEGFKRGGQF